MPSRPWLSHYDPGVPQSLAPYPERTLVDYLAETAREHPERPALLFKGRTIGYGELERESDRFAAALAAIGITPGDRVAICLPNCPQFVIAEYGAWKARAVVAPINPTYTEREMEDALNAAGATTLVVLNRLYDHVKKAQPKTGVRTVIATGIKDYLPGLLRILYGLLKEKKDGERITLRDGDRRFRDLVRQGATMRAPTGRPRPTDHATILMSGGTTGTPKGVLGEHRNMVISGVQLSAWLKPVLDQWTDVIMLPLPLFHTYGNTGVQSLAMVNHNPISLIPNPRDLPDLLKSINTVKPAFICAVPTLLNGILNHELTRKGKINFRSIKLCFCGAAALLAETKRRFEEITGGIILEGYSLTEAQMAVIANPAKGTKKTGSIGIPLPDLDVRILDADAGRTEMPLGEVGEIVIGAPQLMLGYVNRPEETAEILRDGADGTTMLYTGDLAYMDDDGYIFIVDRKKDLIKASGFQVWPREVEEVIAAHPAVAEVGVAGIPDPGKGELVKAWIITRPGMSTTRDEIRAYCREHLAPYKCPSEVEIVPDLPKSMVGKVLRRVLRERDAKQAAGAAR